MKIQEKLTLLQNNHMGEWLKEKNLVEDELSSKQQMFCLCGRLSTGLHELNCRKFRNKIITETVKRLNHLIGSKNTVEANKTNKAK